MKERGERKQPGGEKRGAIHRRVGTVGLFAVLAGGVAVLDAGCGGNITNITIAGRQVPGNFVNAIAQASQTCSEVTPRVLAGLTMVETHFNSWGADSYETSPAGAEGPTQWMPQYWLPGWGSIWSTRDAEEATARRLCADAKRMGLWKAVENYNPGDPSYSRTVQYWADQTRVNYGTNRSFAHHGKGSKRDKGNKKKLEDCYTSFAGDRVCRIKGTQYWDNKTTGTVSK